LFNPFEFLRISNINEEYENHAIVLVNTFFGIDKATILPPNYRLTGPMVRKISEKA